jgi:hypothetical protein
MTNEQPPSVIDAILHHHRQAQELLAALAIGISNRDPAALGSAFTVATRLMELDLRAASVNMLADIAESLRALGASSSTQPAESFADRTLDLALGASPEILSEMLAATERRLDAEQRENARLRARLAAYEPPPPVGVPAVDPTEIPR